MTHTEAPSDEPASPLSAQVGAETAVPPALSEGRAWSFLRRVMSAGASVEAEHGQGPYERRSAHLGAIASTFVDELCALASDTGAERPADANVRFDMCPVCKGSGEVMGMSYGNGPDDYEGEVECQKCLGTGEILEDAK